jgi:hypothetical protein
MGTEAKKVAEELAVDECDDVLRACEVRRAAQGSAGQRRAAQGSAGQRRAAQGSAGQRRAAQGGL